MAPTTLKSLATAPTLAYRIAQANAALAVPLPPSLAGQGVGYEASCASVPASYWPSPAEVRSGRWGQGLNRHQVGQALRNRPRRRSQRLAAKPKVSYTA